MTTFFYFCGTVVCFFLHFIILREKNLHILLLLYLLRLSLVLRTTLCFFFVDIRTCVECRTEFFNLFVNAEFLIHFRVCHGTPTDKNLEITIACKRIKYYVTTLQKINTPTNKQLLQVPSLLTTTFTIVNLMLLRSKRYDHILQLSTIICRHNNKFHDIARIFPLYPQLTRTLS